MNLETKAAKLAWYMVHEHGCSADGVPGDVRDITDEHLDAILRAGCSAIEEYSRASWLRVVSFAESIFAFVIDETPV